VKRIEELFGQYGVERVLGGCDHLIEQTRLSSRNMLERLVPEGRWHGEDSVDDDGFARRPFKVRLTLTRDCERITFDLTGTDDQARGPINFILRPGILTTVLLGRILQAFDEPLILNDGIAAAADEVMLRPGSLLSPKFPAGVALRALSRNSVNNAILKALSSADPRRIPAPSANYGIVTFRAQDASNGRIIYCFEGFGIGMGARPCADGIDSVYLIGQKNNPVDWLEAEYPLRVLRYAIAPDSGGPGKTRGGVGIVREIKVLRDEVILCTMMINAREPAEGVACGGAGRLGRIVLNPETPHERDLPTLADNILLNRGDVIRIVSAGGSGWGNPFERDPKLVAWDVRKGYVTREAAQQDYGVSLDPDTLMVDTEATEQTRTILRQ
jgi:N-methylhydantoinase B